MFRLKGGVLILALLGGPALLSKAVQGKGLGKDSPVAQLPSGPMQEKAAAACTTCHEARIIVQQRLSKAAWTKEMDKMVKWGAEVDAQDRDALIDYFSANFGPDQAAYEAPRTAMKTSGKPHLKAKR